MNKSWVLSQDLFDALLGWLDPQRDVAGEKYEQIRQRLITIFSCRGCGEPEDLADETINRVAQRLSKIQNSYEGNQATYFYGVANKVHLEYWRRKPVEIPVERLIEARDQEHEFRCLEKCLDRLTTDNRNLVLEYYREDRQAKIDHRKVLAEKLGIGANALRIRAYRIRASLQECLEKCLDRNIG